MEGSNFAQTSPKKRQRKNDVDPREDNVDLPDTFDTSKIFNDSVHGHIEVNEACVAIIDTPQFQRLRFIKQLGFSYYVYPAASHNRFEHSIGVCHLAGQMVRSLQTRQPELEITLKDILCVEMAGLCHDLGHGPHSHTFDGKFIVQVRGNMDWKHEKASLDMLDYLLEDNGLMKDNGTLRKHGLDERDILFIKELIYGPLKNSKDNWQYEGRPKTKAFLYEIISNKRTGIDVDKWDYFARDCHHLGIVNNFDHNRFIKFARVIYVDGQLQICARDKEIGNLYQMFYTRYVLHRFAYQHKVSCACEIMAVDVLLKANDNLEFPGRTRSLKLSDTIDDMTAFVQVTDNVLWQIYISQDPKLEEARKIMKRLFLRDLYCCLDERSISEKLQKKLSEKKETNAVTNITTELRDQVIEASCNTLEGSDFRLQIVFMDFGMKDEDPLKAMRYYSKGALNTAKPVTPTGLLIPPRFTDNWIRIYSCNNSAEKHKAIKESFNKFCDQWDIGSSPNSASWEEEECKTPEKKQTFSLTSMYSAGKGIASMSQD